MISLWWACCVIDVQHIDDDKLAMEFSILLRKWQHSDAFWYRSDFLNVLCRPKGFRGQMSQQNGGSSYLYLAFYSELEIHIILCSTLRHIFKFTVFSRIVIRMTASGGVTVHCSIKKYFIYLIKAHIRDFEINVSSTIRWITMTFYVHATFKNNYSLSARLYFSILRL